MMEKCERELLLFIARALMHKVVDHDFPRLMHLYTDVYKLNQKDTNKESV